MRLSTTRDELRQRIEILERAYEYFLGFAAEGMPASAAKDGQLRSHLERSIAALDGLSALFQEQATEIGSSATGKAFIATLDSDAAASRAAMQLVLEKTRIGSQLVDNLNASIHVRALLTDLFLLDEALLK